MLIEDVVRPTFQGDDRFLEPPFGIMGWSMGGYGALMAGALYPELFSAVCGVSPAIWRTAADQEAAVPDAFDNAADFTKHDLFALVPGLRKSKVRIDCGTGDPFYAADKAFVTALEADGQHPDVSFEPGCHNAPFWQSGMFENLRFMATALR